MTDDPLDIAALAHAAMTQPPSLAAHIIALRATLQSCRQMLDGPPIHLWNMKEDNAGEMVAALKTLRLGLSDALFQLEIIERELQKNG